MTKAMFFSCVLGASAALFGCGNTPDPEPNPYVPEGALEIEGTWSTEAGDTQVIEGASWTTEVSLSATSVRIDAYLNEGNELVTQNPADAAEAPSRFNRIVWTEIDDDSFYYCTTDQDLSSSAAAQARNTFADASDPEESGCVLQDGPWFKLTRD